jgi:hypothetical protein
MDMEFRQALYLGIGLTVAAGALFVLSWIILGYLKNRTFLGVEKAWFRCLSTMFYVGLTVLLSTAVASLVARVIKTTRGIP